MKQVVSHRATGGQSSLTENPLVYCMYYGHFVYCTHAHSVLWSNWCNPSNKTWFTSFSQSHLAYIMASELFFWLTVTTRGNAGLSEIRSGVGARMTRHLERKKVTKHTFPPSPARHTHAHTHVHMHKHRPTLQCCVCQMRVWYMTAVTASFNTSALARRSIATAPQYAALLTLDTVKYYLRPKALPSVLHSGERSV